MPSDKRVVGAHNGVIYPSRKDVPRGVKIANEVLVIKSPARRSTWYGIPTYISALGWLTLSVLARDDNILYFDNRREPRWAIILTNLDDDPNLEEDLRDAFRVDLKQPHRNIVVPIEGPGKIEFKQLTDLTKNDMSFDKLQDRAQNFILVAHKMPADRIGLTRVGVLGGSVTLDANRVYKEVVVQTGQAVLAARLNRFIKYEGPVKSPSWAWYPNPLDMTEETDTSNIATQQFQAGGITLNEYRRRVGEPELPEVDPRGSMFITELATLAEMQQGAVASGAEETDANPETVDETTRSGNPDQEPQQ
jgi:capsid portal protein